MKKTSSHIIPFPRPPLSTIVQRGELLSAECPSREVLKHITSRWGVLILMALRGKTLRFSQIRRLIGGISERMLAQTLQWLEQDGIVQRVAFDVVPPHVEYSLTPLGAEAADKVCGLADWIEDKFPLIVENWAKADESIVQAQ